MKKKLILNTLRSVKNTKSRFLAIMAIIAIGCGFFAGVKSAAPDMKLSSADYLEKQGLADVHLMSELGFDSEDVKAVSDRGIGSEIYAGYSADLTVSGGDLNGKIVKAYSYNSNSRINMPYITEGRLPENPSEIVADERFFSAATPKIGDKIVLAAGKDDNISDVLSRTEFTVVGKGRLPVYVAHDRGSASFGNGVINGWLLIPEENFSYEVYTDIYIKLMSAEGVNPYTEEYETAVETAVDSLKDFGETQIEHRKSVVLDEAYEEINDAKAEVADGEKEIADNEKKIADAEKEIADGEAEIAENEQKISDAEKEIADGREELANGEAEYRDGEKAVDALNAATSWINGIISDYVESAATEVEISGKFREFPDGDILTLDDNLRQLVTGYMSIPAAYDDGTKAACRQGLEQYSTGLATQARETEGTLAQSRIQLDNAAAELEKWETEIAEGKEEIKKAKAEIADHKQEIIDGKKEISDGKADIAEAKEEIADAEREAHEAVDDAEWYVFDRDFNPYYSHFAEDCDRVDAIAAVFPIFFILVAALVCSTTMTRMVEEQRTQIGTLKALGYSRFTIISQYILYAIAASVPGGFVGLLLGFNTLPRVIYVCYQSMYSQPYLLSEFKWDYAAGCIVAACLCTGLSALYASRQELVSVPAQLMRPKPPKDGKRILLENIGFIWNRMKFTAKVTFRNLFRYKARLLMTVIGIAGCTALLLTGFGLKESISAIVDRQYGEVFRYDALAALDDGSEDAENGFAAVLEDCDKSGTVTEKMLVMQNTADISNAAGSTYEAYIMVPQKPENFRSFIDLHTRKGKTSIELSDGVVLGEKLAKFLGVTAGDNVYFSADKPIKVTAVCENYTFNYAFMSPEVYEKTGLDELKNNILLVNLTDISQEDAFSEALVKNDSVLAVTFSSGGGDKFRDLVDSLALIVLAIIVSAGALAFVVLFNLSNINVNERIRELATIKVLGFFDGEVAAYIYRENVLSTLMGTGAGLVLGIFLEKFVVKTAEVDAVMFAPGIPAYCFLAAAAITLFFAFLVNLTLYFRLKKIDMATSLKAIE